MARILETLAIVVNANTNAAQRAIGGLTGSISGSLVSALGGATIAGINMAKNLETSFSRVQNLVGITGSQLDELRSGVETISTLTGKSQQELSEAIFNITSAGLRGKEALDLLEASSKASAIGLGETKVVADALTNALNAYGPEALNAAEASDILTAIVREGKVEADALAPSLGKVVGIASTLGVSFEELGANVATYTRVTGSAERATTGLNSLLNAFIKPAEQSKKQADELGLSFEQLRRQIREEGLRAALETIIVATDGNDEALGRLIPNVEALNAVLNTVGTQGEEYTQILANIQEAHGIVEEGFRNVAETAEFKYNVALEKAKSNLIELGGKVLPVVNKLLDDLNNIFDSFKADSFGEGLLVAFGVRELAQVEERTKNINSRYRDAYAQLRQNNEELTETREKWQEILTSTEKADTSKKSIRRSTELIKDDLGDWADNLLEAEKVLPRIQSGLDALYAPQTFDTSQLATQANTNNPEKELQTYSQLGGVLEQLRDHFRDADGEAGTFFANLTDRQIEIADGIVSSLQGIGSVFDALYENQLARIEQNYAREVELIKNSQLTEEQKSKAIIALQEKTAKEVSRVKRRQAQIDKAKAIFDSIINTAVQVTSVIANPVLAAIVGGLGAAQTAIIASQPIPALAEGGLVYGDTILRAGEYANAGINPEVITPLDKLVGIIRDAVGGGGGRYESFLIPEGILVKAMERGLDNRYRNAGF